MIIAKSLFLSMLTLFFIAWNAQAEKKPAGFCENISLLAKTIMTRRQAGAEMSHLIKNIDDAPTIAVDDIEKADSEKIDGLAKEFIVQAYKFPFLYDDELKRQAVTEFENSVYLECYQARNR